MRLSTHAAFRAGPMWALGITVVMYAAVLALPGNGLGKVVYSAVGALTIWVPTLVCWLAVRRVGLQLWEALFAAAAVTSYAAGGTCYGLLLALGGPVQFPSPADVGLLLVYPLMLASLGAAVRHHARRLAWSVWLDCAVGSLGASAVLAVVLSPVLDSALMGSWSLAHVVAVARPMGDLLVLATVAGITALSGKRMGSRWSVLLLGLMAFAAGDIAYALQVTKGIYVAGTPLDICYAVGLALIATWLHGTVRTDLPVTQEMDAAASTTVLVVPSLATAAGLGVLIFSKPLNLSTLAVVLAGSALLAAAGRAHLAYRQLAWMADLRRVDATTDELTGLPNRRVLYAEGHARLVEPCNRRQALLMMDLDKFKQVNDSLGHHTGDLLLIQVATRLLDHVRAGDVLARLGGDEFAVLLEDAACEEATEVAVKLRSAIADPFVMDNITVHIKVSIGIALFPDDGPDLGSLLRKADIAMYKAKVSGNGYHVYRGVDDADEANRLQTVEELRRALTSNQFVVHYQPKVDLQTGDVNGVEALVRWDHPTRGFLHPDAFLTLVEESGLMPALTQMVLNVALDQVAVWRRQGQLLTVAVNFSASCLTDTELPKEIFSMLTARDLQPATLRLEITEEFLMTDRERAQSILTRLRHTGIQISIDDFGTGYSSLAYLRDLPIDELKLDRAFILPMADDARAAALVASTIDLAHSLGLRMVAEGVETEDAYTLLTRLGCDEAQGYFVSRPVPAAELDFWLLTRLAVDRLTERPHPRPSIVRD